MMCYVANPTILVYIAVLLRKMTRPAPVGMPGMQAVERWLDEGWSPWRIGVGAVSLASLGVTVYGYAIHPHHPGSVWWLLGAALVLVAWSVSEMARWRVKHNRLVVELDRARGERDVARRELAAAQRTAIAASADAKPQPLKLRRYTTTSGSGDRVKSYFVGVTNPPGEPEHQVRMSVERMHPYPRQNPPYPGVLPAFPYPVPPAGGGAATAAVTIAPGQEESWRIGNVVIAGDGKISVWRFFRDLDASWELGPDERWRLHYRLGRDGAPDGKFSVVLGVEDGQPAIRLED